MFTQVKLSESNTNNESIDVNTIKKAIAIINQFREGKVNVWNACQSSADFRRFFLTEYLDKEDKDLIEKGRGYAQIKANSVILKEHEVQILLSPRYINATPVTVIAHVPLKKFKEISQVKINPEELPTLNIFKKI